MRLGNLITGALMIKLLAAVVKKSRENDRDIFDMLKEYNDSLQGKSGSNGSVSPPPVSAPKATLFSENRANKTENKSSPPPVHSGIVRPVPAKPDMDVPDYFTPYEGADMTCAEAAAAGFEFEGADRYHGVDFWLSAYISNRRDSNEDILFVHNGPYNDAGIPGCAITGWHGSDKTVKIPRSINGRLVVKIETRAFFGNKEICEIYLPDSVIEIGDHAFFCCYSLKYARLSKNLAHIGEWAFCHCEDLERVYFGGTRVIDKSAFEYCKSLTSVRLPKTVELLGSSCFAYTGLQKLYWDKIICSRERVLEGTPYIENNNVVLLGDCLQKCCLKNVDEIVIDDPAVRSIGVQCFVETTARKVTLSRNVRELQGACFCTRRNGRIEEVSGPGLRKFGNSCFSKDQDIKVSGMRKSEYANYYWMNTDNLYIDENSFQHTPMERFYPGGSKDKPFVCVMLGDILARVEIRPNDGCCDHFINILRLSRTTLTMNYNVKYAVLRHIPTFGAKTLELCKELHSLRSFASVEDFEEVVVRNPVIYARERSSFRPKKSFTLRFWFYTEYDRKTTDSAFFLYVPHSENTEERRRLYELYDKCLGTSFDSALYDREIMNIVSSYRVRFTIAYLRLKGGYKLTPEARERYENFLLAHRRKALFTAKKHDSEMSFFLKKFFKEHIDPEEEIRKKALKISMLTDASEPVRPVPALPDRDVPDNFTPYEGADMTCAEAAAAGFEFEGADRYHGVDLWLDVRVFRDITEEIAFLPGRQYNGAGISGCAVTGWHGGDEIVKVPRSINGRPVVKIGKEAFKGKNIREIYLPDSVIEIDDNAFYGCEVSYARLSKKLVRIGDYAFCRCRSLSRVYLGGVRIIDKGAFFICPCLTELRLPETVDVLGYYALAHTGLKKLYWNKIVHAGDTVVENTPYCKTHRVILFGDCLQQCRIKTVGEIIIDDPAVRVIGSHCFSNAVAKKVTLSENVRELKVCSFTMEEGSRIEEIYGSGLWKFGRHCFDFGQKITVSEKAESVCWGMSATGYLHIWENSFKDTHMERLYAGGSYYRPCVCAMVRNILAEASDVAYMFGGYNAPEEMQARYNFAGTADIPREILTLSEDGKTLTMDDCVEYTVVEHIPTLGAKRLVLSSNLCTLYSFASVEDFEEIVFRSCNSQILAREKLHFRPKKTVTLKVTVYRHMMVTKTRYTAEKSKEITILLYLPILAESSPEAERLYDLYDRCLGTAYDYTAFHRHREDFDYELYDREILNLVSSYNARFTIARLRLEGNFRLEPEARERYENFLLFHKRKAEFTAKKHGDTALLSLLEKLSEKNTDPKGGAINET